MKRISFFLLLALPLFFISCDKESVIGSGELPEDARSFLSTHFPGRTVTQVVKDRDGFVVTYDVLLDGGIDLDFNRKGECTSIESQERLPDSVIPEKILSYVTAQYPDQYIVAWELDDRGQEVRLNTGLELKFDKSGNFLRIDG